MVDRDNSGFILDLKSDAAKRSRKMRQFVKRGFILLLDGILILLSNMPALIEESTLENPDAVGTLDSRDVLNILAKLRIQDIYSRRILYLVTNEQRLIYKVFGVALPVE